MEKKIETTTTKRDWVKAIVGATVGIGGGIVTGKLMKSQYEQNNSTIESVVELAGYIGMILAGGAAAATSAVRITNGIYKGLDGCRVEVELSKPDETEVMVEEEDETDEEEEA